MYCLITWSSTVPCGARISRIAIPLQCDDARGTCTVTKVGPTMESPTIPRPEAGISRTRAIHCCGKCSLTIACTGVADVGATMNSQLKKLLQVTTRLRTRTPCAPIHIPSPGETSHLTLRKGPAFRSNDRQVAWAS